jgi:AraC-like DNA-binding protein
MTLLTYRPQAPAAGFVDQLWLYEGSAPAHAKERALPTGSMELVINLRDETLRGYDPRTRDGFQTFRGPVLCGAYSESFLIDTAQQASIIGVHFKPGGAFPFLNLPAGELHNTHVALDALWGSKAGKLRERLLEATTPAAKFSVLEQSLLAEAAKPLVRHAAVDFALSEFDSGHAHTVRQVTERIGLSPRRFIQVFTREVGLTPKLYCRVRRFQEVLRLVHRRQHVDWVNVALSCGYYDQSHFIRDFRSFAGLSPTAYLDARGDHLNHVALAD